MRLFLQPNITTIIFSLKIKCNTKVVHSKIVYLNDFLTIIINF